MKVDERSKSDENSGRGKSHSVERQNDCNNFAEHVCKPQILLKRAGRANSEEILTIHGMRLVVNS